MACDLPSSWPWVAMGTEGEDGQTEDERVNNNILGISELKWTGMGEFNSDDYYIYYCVQESLIHLLMDI